MAQRLESVAVPFNSEQTLPIRISKPKGEAPTPRKYVDKPRLFHIPPSVSRAVAWCTKESRFPEPVK
jgi:hypothetical protein